MNHSTTIIFAYRNRDVVRVNLALQSLQTQTNKNFQVLLIDYGSDIEYASKLIAVVKAFDFANYVYVGHTGLLWNKSKALNYGIRNATTDYIITADIDVLFTPNFIEKAHQLANLNQFSLFKIGYLSKQISEQQHRLLNLKHIKTTHVGDTFGIGLYPKIVLEKVRGLDEFFHFYGSEDEDLNMRVKLTGANLFRCEEVILYHQWHPRYPQKKDNKLTIQPRLTNILRINQRHFLQNKNNSISHPNTNSWGNCYKKEDAKRLEDPNEVIKLSNIAANVVHFLQEELPKQCKGVIEVLFVEDTYYNSVKYKIKQLLGKQTQPYFSMKEINDLVLKSILFRYRDYNYSYAISKDFKQIRFIIDLSA